jgi:hypothetical protein
MGVSGNRMLLTVHQCGGDETTAPAAWNRQSHTGPSDLVAAVAGTGRSRDFASFASFASFHGLNSGRPTLSVNDAKRAQPGGLRHTVRVCVMGLPFCAGRAGFDDQISERRVAPAERKQPAARRFNDPRRLVTPKVLGELGVLAVDRFGFLRSGRSDGSEGPRGWVRPPGSSGAPCIGRSGGIPLSAAREGRTGPRGVNASRRHTSESQPGRDGLPPSQRGLLRSPARAMIPDS